MPTAKIHSSYFERPLKRRRLSALLVLATPMNGPPISPPEPKVGCPMRGPLPSGSGRTPPPTLGTTPSPGRIEPPLAVRGHGVGVGLPQALRLHQDLEG